MQQTKSHTYRNNVAIIKSLEQAYFECLDQANSIKKSITEIESNMNLSYYTIPGLKREYVKIVSVSKLQKIKTEVLTHLNITERQFEGKRRHKEIVEARHLFCYLAKRHTKASLKVIGTYLGNRDHTTVIHSLTSFQNALDTDTYAAELLNSLEERI